MFDNPGYAPDPSLFISNQPYVHKVTIIPSRLVLAIYNQSTLRLDYKSIEKTSYSDGYSIYRKEVKVI